MPPPLLLLWPGVHTRTHESARAVCCYTRTQTSLANPPPTFRPGYAVTAHALHFNRFSAVPFRNFSKGKKRSLLQFCVKMKMRTK